MMSTLFIDDVNNYLNDIKNLQGMYSFLNFSKLFMNHSNWKIWIKKNRLKFDVFQQKFRHPVYCFSAPTFRSFENDFLDLDSIKVRTQRTCIRLCDFRFTPKIKDSFFNFLGGVRFSKELIEFFLEFSYQPSQFDFLTLNISFHENSGSFVVDLTMRKYNEYRYCNPTSMSCVIDPTKDGLVCRSTFNVEYFTRFSPRILRKYYKAFNWVLQNCFIDDCFKEMFLKSFI